MGMEDALAKLMAINPARLEERYGNREVFQGETVEPPFALRLDGVGWGRRLKGRGFNWPRDRQVHQAISRAALQAVFLLGAQLAYVISDEVNILWFTEPPYGGRVEKLDSIASGVLSSHVSLYLGVSLFFDSRVLVLYSIDDAASYVLYRARVGLNNYLTSLYHARKLGKMESTPPLQEVIRRLQSDNIKVSKLPWWSLYGSCIVPVRSLRYLHDLGVAVERRRYVIVEGYWPCLEYLEAIRGHSGSGAGSLLKA